MKKLIIAGLSSILLTTTCMARYSYQVGDSYTGWGCGGHIITAGAGGIEVKCEQGGSQPYSKWFSFDNENTLEEDIESARQGGEMLKSAAKVIGGAIAIGVLYQMSKDNERKTSLSKIKDQKIVNGEKIFNTKCTKCHIIGKVHLAPDLTGVFTRHTESWVHAFIKDPASKYTDSYIPEAIKYFKIKMPNPKLNIKEINDIIKYLKYIDINNKSRYLK